MAEIGKVIQEGPSAITAEAAKIIFNYCNNRPQGQVPVPRSKVLKYLKGLGQLVVTSPEIEQMRLPHRKPKPKPSRSKPKKVPNENVHASAPRPRGRPAKYRKVSSAQDDENKNEESIPSLPDTGAPASSRRPTRAAAQRATDMLAASQLQQDHFGGSFDEYASEASGCIEFGRDLLDDVQFSDADDDGSDEEYSDI